MIKRTLYFSNPAYLSTRQEQLIVRLPEVEKNETLPDSFKKEAQDSIPIEDIGIVMLDQQQVITDTVTVRNHSAIHLSNFSQVKVRLRFTKWIDNSSLSLISDIIGCCLCKAIGVQLFDIHNLLLKSF
jgi:hypothetical protein